jgi:hypothetical protein
MFRRLGCLLVLALAVLATPASAFGQDRPDEEARWRRRGELGRLFDEYALSRAREELGLDQAQFERFGPRFSGLQQLRRRHFDARRVLVRELARLVRQDPSPGDDVLRERLTAIDEEDRRARADIERAEDDLDEVLTVAQRARFRVFEEELERKKFELMTRARRGPRERPMQ